MLDAVAVGQVTPGPLFAGATFVGFLLGLGQFGLGVAGAIACVVGATAAIFAPAFLLIGLLGDHLERLRKHAALRTALNCMNAALVGLIAATLVSLAGQAFGPPHSTAWIVISSICAAILARFKFNSTWFISGAAIAG